MAGLPLVPVASLRRVAGLRRALPHLQRLDLLQSPHFPVLQMPPVVPGLRRRAPVLLGLASRVARSTRGPAGVPVEEHEGNRPKKTHRRGELRGTASVVLRGMRANGGWRRQNDTAVDALLTASGLSLRGRKEGS